MAHSIPGALTALGADADGAVRALQIATHHVEPHAAARHVASALGGREAGLEDQGQVELF